MASDVPRPAALKIVEGRGNGRDSGGRKVKLPPGFIRLPPERPEYLGVEARAEWDRVVPELQRLQQLKPLDGSSLAGYCESVELFIRATKEVHDGPLVVKNTSRKKDGTETVWYTQNPAIAIQLKAQAAMKGWAEQFGLTSSAEGRLAVRDTRSDDGNPFSRSVGGRDA